MEKCIFCKRERNKVGGLIKHINDNLYICDACASTVYSIFKDNGTFDRCAALLDESGKEREMNQELRDVPLRHVSLKHELFNMTPRQIHRELDKFIVGQEQAKKALSVAVYNHMKRLADKTGLIKKSNILIAGPSGTGKTLFANAIAEMMDVPFAILDATILTPTGFKGHDVEVCLQRLLEKANGNVKLAEQGIIYIDEIDKLANTMTTISGDCPALIVQADLLKMIEGCEVTVPLKGALKSSSPTVKVNTKNILFICGGAFSGLTDNPIHQDNPIGFQDNTAETCYRKESVIDAEALVKYGLMRELVGRLPILVTLDSLEETDLVRILTEPEDAITKEYQRMFEHDGVKLVFKKDALYEIAKMALAKKVGARGIRSILEDVLLQIMYDLPEQDIEECIITGDTVHTRIPLLKKKNQLRQTVEYSYQNA